VRYRNLLLPAVAVVTVLAACDSPQGPQRPTPYEFRLAGTDTVFHWPSTSLPVRFYAEPVGRLPDDVAYAVATWQRQFLYGEFRGVVVTDSAQADVIVLMEADAPPDAPLTDDPPRMVCEGQTLLPPRVADGTGTARFSERLRVEVWWFATPNPSDITNCLRRVTIHELGHALGIFGHSTDPVDLMHPQPSVARPSTRDRSTVETLYHVDSDILPWQPPSGGGSAGG
jgi:predicted Zn-dependent protease